MKMTRSHTSSTYRLDVEPRNSTYSCSPLIVTLTYIIYNLPLMSLITETLSVNDRGGPFRHFRFAFSTMFYAKAYVRYIKDVLML